MVTTTWDELTRLVTEAGPAAALATLIAELRTAGHFHEVFEVRKLEARQRLGLPPVKDAAGEELPEALQLALEEQLFAACREVGRLFITAGRYREAWRYLQAGGERASMAAALAAAVATADNVDELIDVALHEGVDPARGLTWVLEHYGTCNAVTAFESALPGRPRSQQSAAAAVLVRHVHHDLTQAVRAHLRQETGGEPADVPLPQCFDEHPWLFANQAYHLDTTHLAATVRFARLVDAPNDLALAADLADYGRRLAAPFQYPGEPPFQDFYPSHGYYFQALLGRNVDEAVEYFRQQAVAVDRAAEGMLAVEIYIDLLARLGRVQAALDAAGSLLATDPPPPRAVTTLLELARRAGNFGPALAFCRQIGDRVGFVTALLAERERGG